MWDRAYGNKLYVLFFCLFEKKWLKNYWHFVTGACDLYWNPMLCERLVGRTGILLKIIGQLKMKGCPIYYNSFRRLWKLKMSIRYCLFIPYMFSAIYSTIGGIKFSIALRSLGWWIIKCIAGAFAFDIIAHCPSWINICRLWKVGAVLILNM